VPNLTLDELRYLREALLLIITKAAQEDVLFAKKNWREENFELMSFEETLETDNMHTTNS
jgi:hypothetical protein